MPRPSTMMAQAAVYMNDAAQTQYTNTVLLPYLNASLNILQEVYELNSLPITNNTSAVLTIPSGVAKIGYDTIPALPSSLVEILQLWESPTGLNQWTPVDKRVFIPHYLEDNTTISQFLIWAWKADHIEVIPANAINDLKVDGTFSIFNTPILIGDINVNLPFTNIQTYIEFETAGLASFFAAENETRGTELMSFAADALSRALGIPVKNLQSLYIRRRPFRAAFKRRGLTY